MVMIQYFLAVGIFCTYVVLLPFRVMESFRAHSLVLFHIPFSHKKLNLKLLRMNNLSVYVMRIKHFQSIRNLAQPVESCSDIFLVNCRTNVKDETKGEERCVAQAFVSSWPAQESI